MFFLATQSPFIFVNSVNSIIVYFSTFSLVLAVAHIITVVDTINGGKDHFCLSAASVCLHLDPSTLYIITMPVFAFG